MQRSALNDISDNHESQKYSVAIRVSLGAANNFNPLLVIYVAEKNTIMFC